MIQQVENFMPKNLTLSLVPLSTQPLTLSLISWCKFCSEIENWRTALHFFVSGCCLLGLYPTDPFTSFKLQNLSHDAPELNKIHWSPDFEALKLWMAPSGINSLTFFRLSIQSFLNVSIFYGSNFLCTSSTFLWQNEYFSGLRQFTTIRNHNRTQMCVCVRNILKIVSEILRPFLANIFSTGRSWMDWYQIRILPDQSFLNFRASKFVDWRFWTSKNSYPVKPFNNFKTYKSADLWILFSSETLCDGF